MNLLQGKKALVTGASRGIGKAIAMKFASEGADIVFTCTTESKISSVEAELSAYGVFAKGFASDASDFNAAHELVASAVSLMGRIDILVNNAGITRDSLMLKMKESQWDEVINVNLKSAFNFVHAVTPVMLRQKNGSIINMSSVVGMSGNAGQANYSASKAGIEGLTRSVAKEIGSRGIRANAIAPGFIDTDMTSALPDNVRETWLKEIPLRRAGKPEDVASLAVFLASDMSSYITGQVINCSGGMEL